MFPQLAHFADLGLLLLRLMVGRVFITSGVSHLKNPEGRSKSIGMSKSFTIFLGMAEVAGAPGTRLRRVYATRRFRARPAHARSDPKKNLFLAYRLLGGQNLRLAL